MKQIGIYPGTFDPIHEGHIAFAKKVLADRNLDEIIFLPEKSPRSKDGVTGIQQRIDEIRTAISHEVKFSVHEAPDERFDIAKTLPYLQKMYTDAKLTFLFGSDVALHLDDWPNIQNMLASSHIAIGVRSDQSHGPLDAYVRKITDDYSLHITDHSHIRSSDIRKSRQK